MKYKLTYIALLVSLSIAFTSCESNEEKEAKMAQQEQIRLEREEREEGIRIEREAKQEEGVSITRISTMYSHLFV